MPNSAKQKRTACAVAHGAKLKSVNMSHEAAVEMCAAPIKKGAKDVNRHGLKDRDYQSGYAKRG